MDLCSHPTTGSTIGGVFRFPPKADVGRPAFTRGGLSLSARHDGPAHRIHPHRRLRQPGDPAIARRIREAGVYSEIAPFNAAEEAFERLQPKGIIFSGGPASVTRGESPRAPQVCSTAACRCSASATASRRCTSSSAARSSSDQREFGRAFIDIVAPSALVRRPVERRREAPGVDEPRRPGRRAGPGFRGRRRVRRRALRDRHQRGRAALQPDVPPGGRPHARRRQAARQFRAPRLRLRRRLDHGRASATPRSPRSARRSARAG